ncbi:hypothetical protein AAM37_gp74 [Pantoea phage vB_PagM_AAM37]|uniref:Uncharacterized protein n=1 Tax=Pantoea phage vB_PagM_AAM37 TaxID=2588093 RepID=A0A513ZYG3_9CAUD|nr:hypothetical protein HWC22_gp74 [Pantoea phage vB_PagM_AAM37]QDH45745.1 hypothetical protein AAM37_gp74 [Pantoea phage vB_PagM_AAM37]
MRAEYVGQVTIYDMAFDKYSVHDGQYRHAVAVSVTGGMNIERDDGDTDSETLVSIIAAVLEAEEKRGFK